MRRRSVSRFERRRRPRRGSRTIGTLGGGERRDIAALFFGADLSAAGALDVQPVSHAAEATTRREPEERNAGSVGLREEMKMSTKSYATRRALGRCPCAARSNRGGRLGHGQSSKVVGARVEAARRTKMSRRGVDPRRLRFGGDCASGHIGHFTPRGSRGAGRAACALEGVQRLPPRRCCSECNARRERRWRGEALRTEPHARRRYRHRRLVRRRSRARDSRRRR